MAEETISNQCQDMIQKERNLQQIVIIWTYTIHLQKQNKKQNKPIQENICNIIYFIFIITK